jgi:hypothetical protein
VSGDERLRPMEMMWSDLARVLGEHTPPGPCAWCETEPVVDIRSGHSGYTGSSEFAFPTCRACKPHWPPMAVWDGERWLLEGPTGGGVLHGYEHVDKGAFAAALEAAGVSR